jgi:uncharacterized protein
MSDPFRTHGALSWSELLTSDATRAVEFYRELFGWQTREMPMPDGAYHVVSVAGKDAAGIMKIPPAAAGMPPMWGVYVTVDSVDATADKVRALGGTILMGPADIPNVGRFCTFRDPQGAMISAITYNAPG